MSRVRVARILGAAVCALVLPVLSGCGASKGNVSGTVKIDGKVVSVEGLQVTFMADDGRPVCAVVEKDGTYQAVGVQPGENRVSLSYMPPDISQSMEDRAKRIKPPDPSKEVRMTPEEARQKAKDLEELAKNAGALPTPKGFKNPIPERFRDYRDSPLTFTVEGGKDMVFDIEITP
jgi:hypothetical protein